MKPIVALVGIFALSSAANADPQRYTLADLKAMVAQGSYREAVVHLSDIGPSARNAEWLAVAVDAATGYVGGLAGEDLATKVWGIAALDGYPQLLTAPKYAKVRAEVGLRGYEACFA